MEKVELYDFQKDILRKTDGLYECALYLGMGCGKTILSTEHIKSIFQNRDNILVICQKSKILDWYKHLKFYCGYHTEILSNWKSNQWNSIEKYENTAFIINYDLIYRRKEVNNIIDFHLILDESSLIQHEDTKRTKAIMNLEYLSITLLSGTVTSGRYENLWTQCQLLGWDISRTQYWNRYVEWHLEKFYSIPRPVRIVDGYRNVEELKSKLREYGAVFMKTEEAIELPDKIEETINIPTSDCYKRFKKNWVVEIEGEEIVGDTPLNKMLGLRKLASYYSDEKRQALQDILEVNPERVVVFYTFKKELDAIRECAGKRHFCEINGENHDQSTFDMYEDCVIACQYQSSSMGLNLQKSHIIVYYSPTLSADLFMQSQARIHRIGQTEKCNYIYLVCENSVEADIYETLRKRENYVIELFNKHLTEHTDSIRV